ncbi:MULTISPECIES: alpha-keto acid decarboxylase family protein [Acetobacter]|uniref:pyruvate decarboxylase n=1 Tax=Acetobacter thailandicus TaxID=1502842 RepID=A0ABT3QGM6_9PROT|nr:MULTISPECIES: thiamine pyrophosphate-binding protein [Acetobacter]MBS0960910.1 alpha-keto acid decarboxylase family protein [Acetobacter thailandicus]MBS0980967.1 alpha-keto acid decarboxylase family protein [Acetobacter thailandicus]MBS0986655.1 alpha-keto acid decarboxylase family protein [Acetobacter thailandicus]MBS1002852.1 alpha-keto acid decarboxylase family protein [Acetobacter thailandicus]MCX2564442.1 thiamine pyrophosphate-binding protein [Acetobacter thailandicus]
MTYTVGMYLAERLAQIGLKQHFAVAGDYNLVLLDQLLLNKDMEQIYCCNELNCGFSAEGYARAHGAGAAIVTFSVGAISAMNAIGGAYAENLPVILISGSPNSNDYGTGHVLHHTIGGTDYNYQIEMVRHVTCAAESITDAGSAPAKIDHVIRTALRERKPAYLEIACNVASAECPRPGPVSSLLAELSADKESLKAAVAASKEFLEASERAVMLIGTKLRSSHATEEAEALADRLGCGVATMAAAKGYFAEDHAGFRGLYWGEVSSPGTQELVEGADALVCVAPVFNDYSTVGWKSWPKGDKVLLAEPNRVTVKGHSYEGFTLKEFLSELAKVAPSRPLSAQESTYVKPEIAAAPGDARLTNDEMTRQITEMLTSKTTLSAETGDSWFNAMRMHLPRGARLETEMQWGHIGWSVPSSFGNAMGSQDRQHIVMVGDGSIQLTAQEIAQMVRYELPVIIFVVNNRGYVIEIAIHDGPYNYIKNWDYAGLMDVFNAGEGHGLGLRANTGAELAEAIKKAQANRRGPTIIECSIERDDCTDTLIQWGKAVAGANSRKPQVG